MEEEGVVVKVEPDYINVLMQEKSSCDKCGVCDKDSKQKPILKVNKSGAIINVGDKVRIELEPKFMLIACFIIYILPLFGLFVGYFFGYGVNYFIKTSYAQQIEVLLSILGLCVTFVIIHQYDRKLSKRNKFSARIVKIIPKENV